MIKRRIKQAVHLDSIMNSGNGRVDATSLAVSAIALFVHEGRFKARVVSASIVETSS